MTVKEGINLIEDCENYDYILVGVNINHSMRNGFAEDVKEKYPYVYEENLKSPYGDIRKIGSYIECGQENEQKILLLFITKGYPKKKNKEDNIDYLDYESLRKCLRLINIRYKGKTLACPLLGCSRFDGNGNKDRVLQMIEEELNNVDITVYNFYEQSRDEKRLDRYHKNKDKSNKKKINNESSIKIE